MYQILISNSNLLDINSKLTICKTEGWIIVDYMYEGLAEIKQENKAHY